ncbi:sensor histidine kinase [Jatrophihabitans fulvus]
MKSPAGVSWPRLVPSGLLPPEDPSRHGRRTLRDWLVDSSVFVLAAALALLFWFGTRSDLHDGQRGAWGAADALAGVVGCAALWWRRRRPMTVSVLTSVLTVFSAAAVPASVAGFFTVAVHRRTSLAVVATALNLVCAAAYTVVRPSDTAFWVSMLISVVANAVLLAWGMVVRARRQLVWTLRERAERAEAEQRLMAERARRAERTRIAREMHDVLAHRISLLALHAGGLQLRPDLPPEQVAQTAGLLRETAQQALGELRGVIGVLRDETADGPGEQPPAAPQPTLRDIPRLVDEVRRAGARIDAAVDVPEGAEPPGSLGRDVYRIVQEALTNVAKHATGTATTVRVAGAPGSGLHVEVRNRLPVAAGASLPGSGSGLLGLRERVELAGGSLEHGPTADGDFVVAADLVWEAP